jgi:PAS domain-containing protein
MKAAAGDWVGRPWIDTVTSETRQKVAELLSDVAATGKSRPRHLNHPSALGLDIPITYTAVRLGAQGPVLVVGRDMGAVASMQQRILRSQQELERSYWQTRQADTRHGLLFETTGSDANLFSYLVERTPDAVVITDVRGRVLVANGAFVDLVQLSEESRAVGRSLGEWIGNADNSMAMILADLKKDRIAPLFHAALRPEKGQETEVEFSATRLPGDGGDRFGFIVRQSYRSGVEGRPASPSPNPQVH